jgi:hypothetical protein
LEKSKCRRSVASHDHHVRLVIGNGLSEHVSDASHELVFDQIAVRKTGIVREIYQSRVRPRGLHFSEHRETSETGIKKQDGNGLGCV